jgi:hypothetical protein
MHDPSCSGLKQIWSGRAPFGDLKVCLPASDVYAGLDNFRSSHICLIVDEEPQPERLNPVSEHGLRYRYPVSSYLPRTAESWICVLCRQVLKLDEASANLALLTVRLQRPNCKSCSSCCESDQIRVARIFPFFDNPLISQIACERRLSWTRLLQGWNAQAMVCP